MHYTCAPDAVIGLAIIQAAMACLWAEYLSSQTSTA
jgi:hypothetical protein